MSAPLTAQEAIAYNAIVRAAEAKLPCPKNDDICSALGISSVGRASEIVSRLQRKGWISITRGQTSRVVTITETGKRTAGSVSAPHWRERDRSGTPRPKRAKAGSDNSRPSVGRVSSIDILNCKIVDRDPCFFCGARGDADCGHQKVTVAYA